MSTDTSTCFKDQANALAVRPARRSPDPDMQGISRDKRASAPSDAGWRVRLMKEGRYVADRHFRDHAYGGTSRAKKAARCYRDDMARLHGVIMTPASDGALAVIRRNGGLTQHELALRLGVSSAQIAKWERGAPPVALLSLAKALLTGAVVPCPETITAQDIRRVRTELLKWTQQQLADEVGRAYSAVGQWERGACPAPGWVLVYLQAVCSGWRRADEGGKT